MLGKIRHYFLDVNLFLEMQAAVEGGEEAEQ